MLHQYGFGKPKDTLKIEGEIKAPTQIVIMGEWSDPLARPPEPKKNLPSPRRPTRPRSASAWKTWRDCRSRRGERQFRTGDHPASA